jgi:hypothetical protein
MPTPATTTLAPSAADRVLPCLPGPTRIRLTLLVRIESAQGSVSVER